ncbi:MAG: S8 family serine peptidase [Thermoguttaceae bacterium]
MPLRIEQLEHRFFLSASNLLPMISPAWFQNLSDSDTPAHVNPANLSIDESTWSQDISGNSKVYDWIVQFDAASIGASSSLADTEPLLAGAGFEVQAIRGLGLVGQTVVRSSGVSLTSVSDWLKNNEYVVSYEIDVARQLQMTPNDASYSQLWGLNNTGQSGGTADADIDAPEAWDISTGSSDIVVAVIDTGVNYNHQDLAANIWTNPGEIAGNGIDDDGNGFVDDVHGYDFINNDGDPMDDHGHGTHVSGTIAGAGNDGVGVVGVNWSSSIMGLKFLSASGSGYTSDAVSAVNYATMMRTQYGVNVRVTSNSWGGGGSSTAMANAIEASGNAGILFVAAAGNSASNNDVSPHYPSNYNVFNVLSVAATDRNDNLASFSSYGATTVHLAAPGVSIYSTTLGNGYASWSGTSMATPHVSGVAALAWSVDPDATVADIRSAILDSVDQLGSLSGRVSTGGRLNALATLELIDSDAPRRPTVGSLSASPDFIGSGVSTTLTARNVSDSDGTVSAVYFYLDSNGDGLFDAGDELLGTDTTVVGSEASIQLDTEEFSDGQHTLFARALDNDSQWSSAITGRLTIVAPDDHGNSAAAATATAIEQIVDGTIGLGGDQDWFSFAATAGNSYLFQTELTGLSDSVLYLYAQDGVTLLAYNDDVAWPSHPESSIGWTAQQSGTYFLRVKAWGSWQTGGYRLHLENLNDDHADGPANATSLAVGTAASGNIDFANDQDWFAVGLVAGQSYVFETELGTLDDSILYLYDQDGSTLLAYNDDAIGLESRIDWTADQSGTYYLAVEAFDSSYTGGYDLLASQSDGPLPDPTDLGTISLLELDGLDLAPADLWYALSTVRDGLLTIEALFGGAPGNVAMTLYDADYGDLATSSATAGGQRLDWQAAESERFVLKVSGSESAVDLRLANLVNQTAGIVRVYGTSADNLFEFTAGSQYQVTIDDFAYQFESADVTVVTFTPGAGNDTAVLTGSTDDETVWMYPTSTTMSGTGYMVTVSGAEEVSVDGGGGNDTVYLYDSAGDDRFYGKETVSWLTGNGFTNIARNFDRVDAYSDAGGNDRAYLYDSAGDDRFYGRETLSLLTGDGFLNVARNFDRVDAYATAGGNDQAYLYDSAGNDLLQAALDWARLDYGSSLAEVHGFDWINAISSLGGSDSKEIDAVNFLMETEGVWQDI